MDLLDVFDAINRSLSHSTALRRLLEQEPAGAMRLLTSSSGLVQPRAVACVCQLIETEVAAGRYEPPAEPETLAYAIVRLAEAFLYNDAAIGVRGDYERLREVEDRAPRGAKAQARAEVTSRLRRAADLTAVAPGHDATLACSACALGGVGPEEDQTAHLER